MKRIFRSVNIVDIDVEFVARDVRGGSISFYNQLVKLVSGDQWPPSAGPGRPHGDKIAPANNSYCTVHTSTSSGAIDIYFSLVQQHLGLVLHPVVDGVGVGLHQALGHHPRPELVAEKLVGDQDLGGNCKHQRNAQLMVKLLHKVY